MMFYLSLVVDETAVMCKFKISKVCHRKECVSYISEYLYLQGYLLDGSNCVVRVERERERGGGASSK